MGESRQQLFREVNEHRDRRNDDNEDGGELRDEIRALESERQDADVRRACQMFGAEEELAELDRRIAALEAKHRELRGRAQILANEEQVAADGRRREEARRMDEAVAYTDGIRRRFREILAGGGWYLQSSGEGRARIERTALAAVRDEHGQPAADLCRRYLPALSTAGSAGGAAGAPAPVEDVAEVRS